MAKADRYTADGREAIAKAREADVEDKTYQIGEISQKTGLKKTAEGWVTPKGKANAAIEAKGKSENKSDKWEKNKDYLNKEYGGNSAGGAKKNSLENAKKMAESYRKTSNKPIYITEKDGDYVVAKGRGELEYAKENGYRLVPEGENAPRQLTGDCKITIKG